MGMQEETNQSSDLWNGSPQDGMVPLATVFNL